MHQDRGAGERQPRGRQGWPDRSTAGIQYKTVRDHAFTVTGGSVAGARRLDSGSDTPNIRWEITVRPDSSGAVTLVLPATTDCEADGAICTAERRMLSNRLELTVNGPG